MKHPKEEVGDSCFARHRSSHLPDTKQQFPCSSQSLNRTQTNRMQSAQDYCPVCQQVGQTTVAFAVMFVPFSKVIK